MKKALLFAIVFCFAAITALSQIEKYELFTIHPKIGYGLNLYTADFRSFEGAADCGLFKDGIGSGISFGALFERSFSPSVALGLSVNYISREGTLVIKNNYPLRSPDNTIINAKIEDKLEAKLSFLEFAPSFLYTLDENFIKGPLRFAGVLRFGLPATRTFTQYEEIVSPSGAVFIDNGIRRKRRDIASGEITSINKLALGITFGFENNLKIGENTFFTQTLSFDYNLNDFTEDANWKTYAFRLELGVRHTFFRSVEQPKPAPPPPVEIDIYVEAPKIPKIEVLEKRFQGKLYIGNELLATVPLVNAIFFARGSDQIPAEYSNEPPTSEQLFQGNAVELHKNVLARIAQIVKLNPNAQITLEGATSGSTNEPEGLALAKRRAENVKARLVELGVPAQIIKTSAVIMPRFPSNQDFPEGIDENQRVDIFVSRAPLQEYVDLQKYTELDGKISLLVNAENFESNSVFELTNDLTNQTVEFKSAGLIEIPIKKRIDNIEDKTLNYQIKVGDKTYIFTDTLAISKLSKEIVELNLNNFEAILRFDYNSSQLSDDNKGLLRQLCEKLPTNSTIVILGSADALGTAERNIKLSRERATNTEEFIRSIVGNKFKIETGINNQKFDESTPQGRFLNRSIRIRVK